LRLPRDLSGHELAKLLRRYGYEVVRQTGSHIRLTSTLRGTPHHVTIPAHDPIKVGTLAGILSEIATYTEIDRAQLHKELFEK
jgi:predicted RNA binding protein YcfA (HicA-like mRNA interferase family)